MTGKPAAFGGHNVTKWCNMLSGPPVRTGLPLRRQAHLFPALAKSTCERINLKQHLFMKPANEKVSWIRKIHSHSHPLTPSLSHTIPFSNRLIFLRLIVFGHGINPNMQPVDAKPRGTQPSRLCLNVVQHFMTNPTPEID